MHECYYMLYGAECFVRRYVCVLHKPDDGKGGLKHARNKINHQHISYILMVPSGNIDTVFYVFSI